MDPTNPYASPEFPNEAPHLPPLSIPERVPKSIPDVRSGWIEAIVEMIATMGTYGFFGVFLPYMLLRDMPILQNFLGVYTGICIITLSLITGVSVSFFSGWHTWSFSLRFQGLRGRQDAVNKQ